LGCWDAGVKSFFFLAGLGMAIKTTGLNRGQVLHLTNAGAEPFFPLVGLAKPNLIIFYPILQTG
jgi:hypothetical protein